MILMSIVPGHTGYCRVVWQNNNRISWRIEDGGDISVFCRKLIRPWWTLFFGISTGPEFHGMIRSRNPGVVEPYSWERAI